MSLRKHDPKEYEGEKTYRDDDGLLRTVKSGKYIIIEESELVDFKKEDK